MGYGVRITDMGYSVRGVRVRVMGYGLGGTGRGYGVKSHKKSQTDKK